MVEGQNLDIKAENKKLNEQQLDKVHYLKTGKLIEACVLAVCLLKKERLFLKILAVLIR